MKATQQNTNNAVANWLLIGVGMTIIQIALGGITRLTGSGLSITEWDVVTGALPPLNEAQWQATSFFLVVHFLNDTIAYLNSDSPKQEMQLNEKSFLGRHIVRRS